MKRFAAAPMLAAITCYQIVVSPLLGCHCRFEPSCSAYAKQAICMHGVFTGLWLGLKRICRCHPFGASGFDPVPPLHTQR